MGISGRTEGEGGNLGLRRRNCHPGIISFCQSYENVHGACRYENVHGACRERKIFKKVCSKNAKFIKVVSPGQKQLVKNIHPIGPCDPVTVPLAVKG